jgi:hypothetical protein
VQPEPVPSRLRSTLEQWAKAQRSGNARQVASFYAPRVTRHLDRVNVTNAEVRQAYAGSIVRRGVPAIFRISDVRVESESPRQATVRLRKRWQTRGLRPAAGEEEVRLTLVPQRNAWKIVAEEQTRILWTHEPK